MAYNLTSIPNITLLADIPLFPAGLNPFALLYHVVTHPKVKDWAQLALLGLLAELTRRSSKHVSSLLEYWLFVTSVHAPSDDSHDWLMAMWVQHPSWLEKCRRFECETSMLSAGQRLFPWLAHKESKKTGRLDALDRRAAPDPYLIPPAGTTHWIMYNGTFVRFWRMEKKPGDIGWDRGKLQVSILGFRRNNFKKVLADAKETYALTDANKVQVSVIDEKGEGGWRQIATRHKRSLKTVVCDTGVVEQICDEVQQFLDSEDWYISRGVPWRRGYLLEGVPGSGKTSIIHAIASHLDLRIFVVSLASSGLTDSKLARCMTMVPAGAIVVMEDIDVSMSNGGASLQRDDLEDAASDVADEAPASEGNKGRNKAGPSTVTLSGLLNAIDGVAGSEGRILFMTTNAKHRLDKALIRPGRADASFEFRNASKDQAKRLFQIFYPITGPFPTKTARRAEAQSLGEKNSLFDLTAQGVTDLAEAFAQEIPDRQYSAADLQCFLLRHKLYPGEALDALPAWIAGKKSEEAREAQRIREEAEAHASKQAIKRGKIVSAMRAAASPEPRSSMCVSCIDRDVSAPSGTPLEIVLDGKPVAV